MRISDWSSDVCSSDLHRHFAAALAALRPGGRIVAIMPDGFSPGGKHGALFDRATTGSTVQLMLRLDKGFAGKGTSVAVRIIVADKCRSEERRVGKECGSKCRTRWSQAH